MAQRAVGTITRGTTHPNRLRRIDRWLAGPALGRLLRQAADPLVVDVGFGAHPVTTVELWQRLRRIRADVQVVGVEIDPERVRQAQQWWAQVGSSRLNPSEVAAAATGLSFHYGGFELAPLTTRAPLAIRAANVLRQYHESEVPAAWRQLTAALAPSGILVDATCDEIGRRATWLAVSPAGPQSLTLSSRLHDLQRPGELAERLPKALIHHNIPGTAIHRLLADADTAWAHAAPHATFGVRQRWLATIEALQAAGWPVQGNITRWRLGEVTIAACALDLSTTL